MSDRQTHDYELKFEVASSARAAVTAFLAAHCEPDPHYPHNRVVSLYYDTPDLRCLYEKRDGDRYKTKVRVRWYEDAHATTAAWIEIKRRIGSARAKVRLRTDRAPAGLISNSAQPWSPARALLEQGHLCPRPLQPTLLISYRRDRFVERYSGSRICIDSDLQYRTMSSNRSLQTRLPGYPCVMEIKGTRPDPPPAIHGLAHLGLRATSFSKYSISADAMLAY
ncbi:MAG: polyphosphate polymerase domain-containing protein [Acidobacteriota bacterium]|nr:polyphosphate polymerase domain-containing protein [Acidobacteriota bacterium]